MFRRLLATSAHRLHAIELRFVSNLWPLVELVQDGPCDFRVNFVVADTALLADFTSSDPIQPGRFCQRSEPQS